MFIIFFKKNKRLYYYYPQRPVRFDHFLANPPKQTYFFNDASIHVYNFLLAISLLWKIWIFPRKLKKICCIRCLVTYLKLLLEVCLLTSMTILITRSGKEKQLHLDCKKKLVVLKQTQSNLDGAMLKNFWFQIIYRMQPLFLCMASTPPMIFDIVGLKFIDSNMFFDNKVVLFCLLCLQFSLDSGSIVMECHTDMLKMIWQNNWKMIQNNKMERRIKLLKSALIIW